MTARDEAIAAMARAIDVPTDTPYVARMLDAIPADVLIRLVLDARAYGATIPVTDEVAREWFGHD
jgi:hypothetical protein